MQFIENKGQWKQNIAFQTKLNFGEIFFEKDNFTFVLTSSTHNHHKHHEATLSVEKFKGHHFKLQFLNAKTENIINVGTPSTNYYNYFLGKNPENWANYVRAYTAIKYQNLYDGIDMLVKGEENDMKYEYYLQANTDASLIQVAYLGVENLHIKDGHLFYQTSVANIQELKPYAYQIINGKEQEVACNFMLNKKTNTLSFDFPNGYDKNIGLVIDPRLIFSRLSGSTNWNFGFTATYDAQGRAYGGGIVFNTGGFYPTTLGAFDETYNGGNIDIGISCYHQTTGAQIYATYIGGNNTDLPNSMIVNNMGELVILGTTGSSDFPMNALNEAYDTSFNGGDPANFSNNGVNLNLGSDMVVLKLSNDGSSLNAATYLGGTGNDGLNDDTIYQNYYDNTDLHFNYGDAFRGEVIIDVNDNIYIASSTNSNDYPLVNSTAFLQGEQDGVITKLNTTLDSIFFSRYIGGTNDDASYSMKIDDNGNLFVVGGTKSTDFPATINGATQPYLGGDADGYIAKLNGNLGHLLQAIYIGTSSYDQAILIDLDLNDNVYVVGQTLGNYPIFNAAYGIPNTKHFIHKFNNDLTSSFYSTTFGSDTSFAQISPTALLIDVCDRVFVSGWGGYTNFYRNGTNTTYNLTNLPITSDAIQSNYNGFGDFYFFVLDKNANSLEYATFFGGTAQEHVDGGTSRFDENGIIYQAVCAACSGGTFSTSTGYTNTTNTQCNLGVIKFDLELPTTNVNVDAFPRATGCTPLTVNFFSDTSSVSSMQWDFGDGNTSTDLNPIHTFTDTGTYFISLIGIDSNSCNQADTAILSVLVEDDSLSANFASNIIIDCNSLSVSAKTTNYSTTDYVWNMGDGNFLYTDSIYYEYTNAGTYNIKLGLTDSTSCELSDSSSLNVTLLPTFTNQIQASDTFGCIPLEVNFSSSYLDFDSAFWDFGNGNFDNTSQPIAQTYNNAGNYTASLILIDSNTCNVSDTAFRNITTINDSTHIDYSLDSTLYQCDSMQLNAVSNYNNATSYFWNLGNGQTASTQNASGIYNAGNYIGTHILTDTNNICYPSDTAYFNIDLLPRLHAKIVSDTFGCIPFEVPFNAISSSTNASYDWTFGDGNSSALQNPTNTYMSIGTFTVNLSVTDTNTCNGIVSDTTIIETATGGVIVDIQVTPVFFGCDSVVVNLNANYVGGTHEWNMGNGDVLIGPHQTYTYTQFGNYQITYTINDSTQECLPQDTAVHFLNFYNVQAIFTASDTVGCVPLEVDFTNLTTGNNSYWWNDGRFVVGISEHLPTLTYNSAGNFPFTLVVTDSSSCNILDTAVISITPSNDFVTAAYNFEILHNCDSLLSINLNNQSTNAINYYWNFENSTSNVAEPGNYEYTEIGNYTIQLVAENQNLCNPLDTVAYNFELLPNSVVSFEVITACETDLITLNNLSNTNAAFVWNFGDGQTSNDFNPSHTYSNSGFYNIQLIIIDTNSCNLRDTLIQEIEVYNYPTARFTTDSNYYIYPDKVTFTNLSVAYNEFMWEFGDGIRSNDEIDPIHFYESVNSFQPCLYVSNEHCVDTICKEIIVDFIPLIGVPNAFSPNGDGINDQVFVEGIGITKINFRIFNRWGELVFKTDNQQTGWDGTYLGKPQEQEVYTYLINCILLDNSSKILKGNITLLR